MSPVVKHPAAKAGDAGLTPESGRALEKEMATASSVLAWEIPWTEEPGGLCACGHKRVGYNLPTKQQQSRPAYSWKATGGIKSEQGQPYPMLKSKEREEKQIWGGFPGKESTC